MNEWAGRATGRVLLRLFYGSDPEYPGTVGIARAIVMNPKYLFCDEPNSGLDPLTAVKIDLLIQEITEEYNITTVVISHDMNSVMRMGEYIMFLKDGKKLWEGSTSNLLQTTEPALQEFLSTKLI